MPATRTRRINFSVAISAPFALNVKRHLMSGSYKWVPVRGSILQAKENWAGPGNEARCWYVHGGAEVGGAEVGGAE